MAQVNIEDFINKHLVKLLWAVVVYFLMDLSSSFKEVKVTLQQLLINQSVIENRMTTIESNDRRQDAKMESYEASRTDFYKTYKLTKKDQ